MWVPYLIVLISSFWVLYDAKKIGIERGQIEGFLDMGAWSWFFCCLFFWIVSFPMYLVRRPEYIKINNSSEKNYCTECGSELIEGASFCQECGQETNL